MFRSRLAWLVALVLALGPASVAVAQTPTVSPIAQTPPFAAAPVTPAIWVNPSAPGNSVVYAADGNGNLAAFDLAGALLGSISTGRFSDVSSLAVVYDVPVQGVTRDYLVVGTAAAKTITLQPIDGVTGQVGAEAGSFTVLSASGSGLAHLAVYRSPVTGGFFVFVSDATGNIEQWQLIDTGGGNLGGSQVARTGLSVGEGLGGMVADEVSKNVYVTGQSSGLWRFDAEPDGAGLSLVDSTSGALQLIAPLGGLALYRARGTGYLLVADVGSSDFAVYDRGPISSSGYLTRFQIGSGNGLDGVQNPQRIAVMSFPLGTAFPTGLFVTDDGASAQGGPELKYASWGEIADAGSLSNPTLTDNPHAATDAGTPDGGVPDGGTGPDTSKHSSSCSASGGSAGGLLLLSLLLLPVLLRRRVA